MNINKDIKETVRLSALDNLAARAGITRQQVDDAKRILTISNQDAMQREMEQMQPPAMAPMSPPPAQPMPSDPQRMAKVKAVQDALRTESQLDNLAMMRMKEGGMVYGGYSGMVPGEGHGMEDNVYMPIVDRKEGEQVATLAVSPDEYIVDAATVAALGNGSSDAGA